VITDLPVEETAPDEPTATAHGHHLDKALDVLGRRGRQMAEVRCLPALELRDGDGQLPAVLRGATFQVRVMGRCADCMG